jgi:isoleucyl-tRNA synthetase
VARDGERTQELVAGGLGGDGVRRVQSLRKEAGCDLDDRIITAYEAEEGLAEAIEEWRDYIAAETLSVELERGFPDKGQLDAMADDQVEGYSLKLGVTKA